MATVIATPEEEPRGPEWTRKYPPLLAVGVALLLALVVLPSSLNLPQTNPQQTLEYAPVPPEDENDTSQDGNLSALGLGNSAGIQGGGAEGGNEGGAPEDAVDLSLPDLGQGRNPTRFRCVGNPPRQTEDPLAPPCVPFFDGDNFGATYQGVTGDEIRLLVYFDPLNYISTNEADNASAPSNKYYDLFKAPDPDEQEHFVVRGMRAWQKYFNERFQTYNRRVHFFLYFSNLGGSEATPEERRADAADNFNKIKPFAVLTEASSGAEDGYLVAMARKGVLNFGSFRLRPASFFNAYPKMIWSYQPSIEQLSEAYSSYVCQKLVNQAPTLASAELQQTSGGKRKFGILHTTDRNESGYIALADQVRQKVEACGGKIEATATYPDCCLAQDNSDRGTYAETQMETFRRQGITTILWPGGINGKFGKAAAAVSYYPEWVLAGDGSMDSNRFPKLGGYTSIFDGRALMITPEVMQPALEQQLCFQAYREVDPEMSRPNMTYLCDFYKNLFQIFVGIQVAGPKLGPSSIDKGFHAIPSTQSNNVQVPSCFYLPGDYTCVKDAQAEIWRAGPLPPGDSQPGCWAGIEGGRRYQPNKWPSGNATAQINGQEPCNGFNSGVTFWPYPQPRG